MQPMQMLLSLSRLIVLAVLSCIFIISWNVSNKDSLTAQALSFEAKSIFTPSNSIWTSISRDFGIDHKVQSARVKSEIRKLVADQGRLYKILKAAGPYIYYIHTQTKEYGLPAELALIPVIESEFNPNDHSNKGALGLWQLMFRTATELGVRVRSGYDGRRNIVDSTKAALTYFNDLGNSFHGDWYLAIAAYNCGPHKVTSVQRRSGAHSFWNLSSLPRDTKYYVPRLLAIAAIVKHPEKYGVKLPPIKNEPYFTELKTNKSVNLNQLAKTSGVSLKTLKLLNPDYRGTTLPKKGAYSVLIPIKQESAIKATLKNAIINKA